MPIRTEATLLSSLLLPLRACGLVVGFALLTSCVMDPVANEDLEQSPEREDGRSAGVVGLTPGGGLAIRAQCEEWFSCDLDVNIHLDSLGLNAVYAEAEDRADLAEVEGDFRYQLPLFRVRITEEAPQLTFAVDVAAEVSGSRVAGSAIASDFSFVAGGRRMDSDLLTLFAESEDEDAAYDIELESIQDLSLIHI